MWRAISFVMNTVIVAVSFFGYCGIAVVLFLFAASLMFGVPLLFVFVLSGGSDSITGAFAVVAALFWGLLIFCRDKLKIAL